MIYRELLKEYTIDNEVSRLSFLEEADEIIEEANLFKVLGTKLSEIKDSIDIDIAITSLGKAFESNVKKTEEYFIKNSKKALGDKDIEENKKLLVNYTETISLSKPINYHDYANLDANIPSITPIMDFCKEYSESIKKIIKLSNSREDDSRTKLLDELTKVYNKTLEIVSASNKIYTRSIKEGIIKSLKDPVITASDDSETINDFLNKIFIGNQGFDAINITTISPEMVQRSYARYSKLDSCLKSVITTRNVMLNINKKVLDTFKSIKKDTEDLKDPEVKILLSKYRKAKYFQINMLYSILWNIYYTRLALIYSSSIRDRQICLKAIEWAQYHNIKVNEDYTVLIDDDDLYIKESFDQLEYENYLAYKECFNMNEQIYLTEVDLKQMGKDMNNAINNFLKMIIANIQKVWNNFQAKGIQIAWNKINKTYANQFEVDRPMVMTNIDKEKDYLPNIDEINKFISIPNGQEAYNTEKIRALKAKVNGEDQEISDEIAAKYTYFGTGIKGKNFPKVADKIVQEKCFYIPEENSKIDLNIINNYRTFLDGYEKAVNAIQEDIKNANARVKDFENASKAIQSDQSKAQENIKPANTNTEQPNQNTSTEESALLEMDIKDEENPSGKKDKSTMKVIKDFFKIYNTVLSLKMKTISRAMTKCMSICLKYGRNVKRNQ